AVASGTRARAEEFVAEIAMACLDVDEREAGVASEAGRVRELHLQPRQLVVVDHAHAARKAAIEDWMGRGGERRGAIVDVGARVASRVRQLQADEEIGVCVRAESLAM